MMWIVVGVALVSMLVLFRYPLFMPNIGKDMTREEIVREVENMKNLKAELDAKKGLSGDQDLWRHVPGAPWSWSALVPALRRRPAASLSGMRANWGF